MENVGSWRAFADALGYVNLPLAHFCRTEPESEPEKAASVLERLKEDCNAAEGKDRKSFQNEVMTVCTNIQVLHTSVSSLSSQPVISVI